MEVAIPKHDRRKNQDDIESKIFHYNYSLLLYINNLFEIIVQYQFKGSEAFREWKDQSTDYKLTF